MGWEMSSLEKKSSVSTKKNDRNGKNHHFSVTTVIIDSGKNFGKRIVSVTVTLHRLFINYKRKRYFYTGKSRGDCLNQGIKLNQRWAQIHVLCPLM